MTQDVPDDLLPDEPHYLGDRGPDTFLIYGAIFPEDSTHEFDSPVACDKCEKESTKRHVGFDEETKERMYLCSGCHTCGVIDGFGVDDDELSFTTDEE